MNTNYNFSSTSDYSNFHNSVLPMMDENMKRSASWNFIPISALETLYKNPFVKHIGSITRNTLPVALRTEEYRFIHPDEDGNYVSAIYELLDQFKGTGLIPVGNKKYRLAFAAIESDDNTIVGSKIALLPFGMYNNEAYAKWLYDAICKNNDSVRFNVVGSSGENPEATVIQNPISYAEFLHYLDATPNDPTDASKDALQRIQEDATANPNPVQEKKVEPTIDGKAFTPSATPVSENVIKLPSYYVSLSGFTHFLATDKRRDFKTDVIKSGIVFNSDLTNKCIEFMVNGVKMVDNDNNEAFIDYEYCNMVPTPAQLPVTRTLARTAILKIAMKTDGKNHTGYILGYISGSQFVPFMAHDAEPIKLKCGMEYKLNYISYPQYVFMTDKIIEGISEYKKKVVK